MFEKEKCTSESSKPITFSQKDLRRLGFSMGMIKTLLPEPELKPNPHYLSASPMREYKAEDVLAAMATREFAQMAEEHRKRSEIASAAAEKAAVTKEKKLAEHAGKIASGLEVPSVNEDELRESALVNQVELYSKKNQPLPDRNPVNDHKSQYSAYVDSVYRADEKTKKRWMLNYLLFAYTDYPRIKRSFARKPNGGRAICIIRHAYYRKAAEANPYLASACEDKLKELTYDVGYHPEDYPDEETGETTDPTVLRKEPPAYAVAPLNEVMSDVCRLLDIDHPVVEYADGFNPGADPVKAAAEYFPETDTLLIRTAYMTEDSISLAQYAAARELCLMWMYRKEGIPWEESEYPDDGFNLFWCETLCADVMATALMNFCFGGMDWDRCGIIQKNTDHWYEFDERVDWAMEVLEKKRADGAYQIRLEDVKECGW